MAESADEDGNHPYYDRCLHYKAKFRNKTVLHFNPITSGISALIIWSAVVWCIAKPEQSSAVLSEVRTWITDTWTWLYVGTQDVWALFIFILYFSKYSHLKLGKDDEKPEYSDGTYFMMLFSCGVGIGLFYYGVAEPIYHYKPPGPLHNRYWGKYNDNQRAQDAINVTYFHWGIHGWVVYVLIGMLLGFLCYRRGLPLTMRTCFYPIFGDKVFGRAGDLIDTLCIVCTMFGVCTSLGYGALQLNAGFSTFNRSIPENVKVKVIIIWGITALATISVVTGIKLGIRRLSEICFGIGTFILLVVVFSEKTWYLLNVFVQSVGYYFQWIIQLGFHTDAFAQLGIAPDKKENPGWMEEYTLFYWGWWISWSPFVGMFIAKISRGRTIKEFIMYTLTIPCCYAFFWFAMFGGVGIRMENTAVIRGLNCSMYTQAVEEPDKYETRQMELFASYGTTMLSCRASTDMWFDVMRSYGRIGVFMSACSLVSLVLYFVTSSDSGSLVIDCISANGHPEPPVIQRIFWALTEGATATALLVAGGEKSLVALQTVSVACGLPFTFVLNWTCVAMWRAVREEAGEIGIDEGKWKHSLFTVKSKKWYNILISVFSPWVLLVNVKMKIEGVTGLGYKVCHSMLYAVPFYLWILCLIYSIFILSIINVAWAILFFFFAFASNLRGDVREKYNLDGNMVEDFFACLLLYPFACLQMYNEVIYRDLPNGDIDRDIEMVARDETFSMLKDGKPMLTSHVAV